MNEELKYKLKRELPEAIRDADRAIDAARNCNPQGMFDGMRGFYQNINRSTMDFDELQKVTKMVENDVITSLQTKCSCQLAGQKVSLVGGVMKKVSDAQKKAIDFAFEHPEVILKIAALAAKA